MVKRAHVHFMTQTLLYIYVAIYDFITKLRKIKILDCSEPKYKL